MITVKNSQLDQETVTLLNELVDTEINASSAFVLTRIIKEISEIVKDKTAAEVKIIQKYVRKEEDGSIYIPKDENGNPMENQFEIIKDQMEEFKTAMEDLMKIENSLNYKKLVFDKLGLDKFSVKKCLKIGFLFEGFEEEVVETVEATEEA